ncbi:MAG: response regulator transcription factor [Bryobacteraceae bacterium]|jgi:two-component system nitrate/nitrite response regulator NarL
MTELKTKTVGICDTQPIAVQGLKALLIESGDLCLTHSVQSLDEGWRLAEEHTVDILLIDKAFGMHTVLDWLIRLRTLERAPAIVIWGISVTEAEALRFLQGGAKAIIRKTSEVKKLISCLSTVAEGRSWMEDRVLRDSWQRERGGRSELTAREQQVMQLVEQGFKNREIATELGIRPGTVKIHLKHIFEKTGVRGRYGLALTGLREKGVVSLAC